MNTKTLSQPALDTIDQYLHFKIGTAECNVPYYNNKVRAQRAGLRATIGKGSPREILDEVEILGMRASVEPDAWTGDLLKRFMSDQDIGIDCSGLAYYLLSAENSARRFGALDRHLSFAKKSILRRILAKLRPVENADVLVFASDANSHPVALKDILPGDYITMNGADAARNHIVVVHQVDYQNFVPAAIHYTNSIAWPQDGEYGHGVRQGNIEIIDPAKPLLEQRWTENGQSGDANGTLVRAKTSKQVELRRLKWWK